MAKINLNSSTPLKIVVVPAGNSYDGNAGTAAGTFLFKEADETITVRGKVYHGFTANSNNQLSTALSALTSNGILTSSTNNGIVTYTNNITAQWVGGETGAASIQSLFETLASNIGALEKKLGTVGSDDIVTQINNLAERITNAQSSANNAMQAAQAAHSAADDAMAAANNRVQSVSAQAGQTLVTVAKSPTSGTGPYNVTVGVGNDLTNAVTAAMSAVQTVVLHGANSNTNLFTKSGTTVQGTINGVDLLVGNSAATGATASAYHDSTISAAINSLKTAIDTITGSGQTESLTDLLNTINQIKNELQATDTGDESKLSTIIDSLRKLKVQTTSYLGITDTGAASTSGNEIALQTSLQNLATYAATQASAAQSAAISAASQDATTKASTAQSNAISQAQSKDEALEQKLLGATGTSGNTILSAKADAAAALQAAQNAAADAAAHHSVVQGPTGTASSNAYVMVSAATGASGQQVYTVQSTAALDSELSRLDTAASNAMQAAQSAITWEVIETTAG